MAFIRILKHLVVLVIVLSQRPQFSWWSLAIRSQSYKSFSCRSENDNQNWQWDSGLWGLVAWWTSSTYHWGPLSADPRHILIMECVVAFKGKIISLLREILIKFLPLIKFWFPIFYPNIFQFQTATKAKGRGVQRLLLLAQRINLLGIPAMAMLVFFRAVELSENLSYVTCFFIRMVTFLLATNRMLSEPAVALGRYVN